MRQLSQGLLNQQKTLIIMRKILISCLLAIFITAGDATAAAQTAPADPMLLVTMPEVPSSIERLDQRCNYILNKYWDTFNPKSSFSSHDRLNHTLGIFFGFTPYATADTVHLAIDKVLGMVAKAEPKNLIKLAKIAECWTMSDTAEYLSEELYFPFVEAVALNKKAKGPERDRIVHQYNKLLHSRVGETIDDIDLIRPDGGTDKLSALSNRHTLLFFFDPECDDCKFAKVRLDADYTIGTLVKRGIVTIIAIYPGEADEAFRKAAADMPKGWKVYALPQAGDIFTLEVSPEIYYVNRRRKILAKDLSVDGVLNAFRAMVERSNVQLYTPEAQTEPAADTTATEPAQ